MKYNISISIETFYSVLWAPQYSVHFWQRLQPQVFLGMTLQAWHSCIWGVSPILLCRSSQALSGWMGRVTAHLFSVLSRDVDRVQVRALAGPLKDIQRLVPQPLLHCLGCVLRVVVLLEGEPSPQYEVLSALEQVFIKDLSVVFSIHLSFDPD